MAIISSVLTGKAKGKIGNIVLATVKGQTTAREYNPNPTYSDTAGQTLQRGRLRNAVMAWQFLNVFLQYAKPMAKSTESVYNAFIRLIVNLLPEIAYTSRAEAGSQALAELLYPGNYATISLMSISPADAEITFNANYFPWQSGIKLILLSYDTISGERVVKVVPVTESAWNSGNIVVSDDDILDSSACCYFLSADGSKMSNIFNVE